jgi:hypothetical protein
VRAYESRRKITRPRRDNAAQQRSGYHGNMRHVTDFVLRKKYLVKRNGKKNFSGNLILTIYVTPGAFGSVAACYPKTLRRLHG